MQDGLAKRPFGMSDSAPIDVDDDEAAEAAASEVLRIDAAVQTRTITTHYRQDMPAHMHQARPL